MKPRNLYMLAAALSFGGVAMGQQRDLQYWRPYDQRGVNVFETSKQDTIGFTDQRVRIGGHFTQQFQGLRHSNQAEANVVNGVNLNELKRIGNGFNLATANLIIDAQLEDGIRVHLATYLSSRHHQETWVKGGYIQFDKLPFFKSALADKIMENVTIRIGHMEINYGDAHFRRSDNGNAVYNPFVENLILDAFTTEIGGEVYYQKNGFLAMGSITGGEVKGDITQPEKRSPAYIGKIGYDKQLNEKLRVRLTGSVYGKEKSVSNTLYSGDRTGSRYYLVMDNVNATTSAQFTSGRFSPGYADKLMAFVVNPFVKVGGLEVFGNLEFASGRGHGEPANRETKQYSAEAIYRFPQGSERFFIGGRYNTVESNLKDMTAPITINRVQASGGWFVTKNILAKVEYVDQQYKGFLPSDIRHGGRFNGLMFEAVLGF
ncbi:hypothetical protein Q0590_16795 [Rhodocytophaga aerolata]|uniref:Porin n=1 Tax=Rhodocytophaga aerolata TaxID=455078 RepID=A0ABT8R754_9BACT|nr:hypothetical protein [Rhodocytophaga aerolata]MDO1447932.1 hypothetical protein [Rhodocytophaga aerolata]